MTTPDPMRLNAALLTIAVLAAAIANAPSEAAAACPTTVAAAPSAGPLDPAAAPRSDGIGGPIEPVQVDVAAILVEGRKADDGRWTGAVDPALARRYGAREPARYNQITIPF